MSLEIKIENTSSKVKLLERTGNRLKVLVNDKVYDIDFARVGNGIYSILHENESYNVELVEGKTVRDYFVNTPFQSYEVKIIDAQARYEQARHKVQELEGANIISSPMPGKVVRVLVKEGDSVEQGQAIVVISAMKMESEYKAGVAGVIKKVNVKENDTIEGNQALVIIEQ